MGDVAIIARGDLFASSAQAIVNPVNCVGVMGKGLALTFKQRYPLVFDDYQAACATGRLAPGRCVLHLALGCRPVISLPTKNHWRQPSTLELVLAGVADLARLAAEAQITSLAVPALGCGAGGLRWATVRDDLQAALSAVPARVELYAPH